MKKLYKLLVLPLVSICCSAHINEDPSIEFVAFAIENENLEARTLKVTAYINILVTTTKKGCNYRYYWIGSNEEEHKCGVSGFTTLVRSNGVMLYGCATLDMNVLDDNSPVTFRCDVEVTGEPTYQITMPYNMKGKDEITISESVNNVEQSTGYIKESTFVDPSLNYRYEDVISFLNYEDLRVNDLYLDIDISYLKFKYRNGLDEVLKGELKFAFYDRYNLFPDFPVSETSMYRYIPLTFNRNGDECYFTFTPTIYYDPKTHESSLTEKENYLPYHNLMLPFAASNELKFLPCYIELKVHSHTDFTITGKFMMTYLKKYFGECADSEFCDEMHQDDEINIREKTVEVII